MELAAATQKWQIDDLLHGFEESLAVVLKGHDELELSSSGLHRCEGERRHTNVSLAPIFQPNIKESGNSQERPASAPGIPKNCEM